MAVKQKRWSRRLGRSLDPVAIGKRIRERRKSLGLSQGELGRLAGGIDFQVISKYERGVRIPLANLTDLAGALGMTAYELVSGEAVANLRRGEDKQRRMSAGETVQQAMPGNQSAEVSDSPELVVTTQILRAAPEFLPWVVGLLRIFKAGNMEAKGAIQAAINGALLTVGMKAVGPTGPARPPRTRKE